MPATLTSELLNASSHAMLEAIERMDKLVAGLSETQANFKPGPKKWSINECLDHINSANRLYAIKLENAFAKARAKGRSGAEPYGNGTFLGRFILNVLREGPGGRRVPAPGVFKPGRSELKLATLVEQFRERAGRLVELAEQADGLPLGRIKFTTPAAPVGRVAACQVFEMMHLHSHRHLAQAERVKTAEGYPAA
jgi:hypothetical protein